jgi:hypothetical protein
MPLPFLPNDATSQSVEGVAHIIQTALTPVFMLSGIGTLLNLFNTRLARVSDHLRQLSDMLVDENDPSSAHALRRHVVRLHRRMLMLDVSIFLGAIGGASTCGAALVLFLGTVRESAVASALVVLFGIALLCTVAALASFLGDAIFAWHGIRTEGPLPQRGSRRG